MGIVLKQMMHFIKRMLELGIWNRESWASSGGRKMNSSTLSSGMNQQIRKKLLFQPLKWAYTFKLHRTENNFLNYISIGFALNISCSFLRGGPGLCSDNTVRLFLGAAPYPVLVTMHPELYPHFVFANE
jgi:hypothetical protein